LGKLIALWPSLQLRFPEIAFPSLPALPDLPFRFTLPGLTLPTLPSFDWKLELGMPDLNLGLPDLKLSLPALGKLFAGWAGWKLRFPDIVFPALPALPEIWTSAGMTAGIDLCLALLAHDHGEDLAREAARQLVVERRRPGGQSQFSPLLDLQRPEGRFGALLEQVRQRLHEDHSVEALAAAACMSPRHFARCFRAETGTTPAHAIERLRVEAARAALEGGAPSVQRVATACGFGSTERMRRSFQRLLGRPPAAFRKGLSAP
jgi:AraC-like DNA-binding protein